MSVTLKQIAEKAGVSIPTVSRVLNNRDSGVKVRDETRERILSIAAELGYRPNLLARGLVGSRSSLIGVIVRDIADPFLNKVLKGMYDAAIQRQYRLFLGHVGHEPDTTLDYGSMFEQSHADGIIVMGDMRDDEIALQTLTEQHKYVVGVTDRTDRRRFPGVYGDSEEGAALAMQHLWELGHRHIICVTDPAISDGRLRASLYEAYMRNHGVADSIQIYEVPRSIESGYQLGQKLFSESSLDFTAIFAITDTLAIGLMKAAFDTGVSIPDDVSIIGYDDIDIAPYSIPALTTVSQSGHEMGFQTTTLLVDMIERDLDIDEVEDVIVQASLIVRASTKRLE